MSKKIIAIILAIVLATGCYISCFAANTNQNVSSSVISVVNNDDTDSDDLSFFEKIWNWILWLFSWMTGRNDAKVLSLTIPTAIEVAEGGTKSFNYKVVYKDSSTRVPVEITIADESIISLDYSYVNIDGVTTKQTHINGLKPGTTTITVTCDDLTETCKVTVRPRTETTTTESHTARVNVAIQDFNTLNELSTTNLYIESGNKISLSWIEEQLTEYYTVADGGVIGIETVAQGGETYTYTVQVITRPTTTSSNITESHTARVNVKIRDYESLSEVATTDLYIDNGNAIDKSWIEENLTDRYVVADGGIIG